MANLTDLFNALKQKDESYEYNPKDLPPFVLSIFLSYNQDLLPIVQEMNKFLRNIPDKAVWKYYMRKTPYKFWLKFPKKTPAEKYRSERINEIMELLDISFDEAKRISINEEKLRIGLPA
jgi:hypothetical protein